MEQKEVKLPTTWHGWATRVSAYVKAGKEILGEPRFPIKISEIAQDYSRNLFPKDPITLVKGRDFGGKFEGALVPNSAKDEWAIFFDQGHASKGRINFSLAHEFCHYLAHRHLSGEPFYCSRKDMWGWDSAYAKMEQEANQFAALVLMPPDDFRVQTANFRRPTLTDFEVLRDRYQVSITSAVINWLQQTKTRAMIVVSNNGFIDWSWCSEPLLKSGVYFKPRQITTPLPPQSLAAIGPTETLLEIQHPVGVWSAQESVFESVIFSEYHDMCISLLIFPSGGPDRWPSREDDLGLMDTFEAFQR